VDVSPLMIGRYPASGQPRLLIGQLLLFEPDAAKRAAMARDMVERAGTLVTRLSAAFPRSPRRG
jgi:hypothetical protein